VLLQDIPPISNEEEEEAAAGLGLEVVLS